VQACVLQSCDAYWLPTPSSYFPFTSLFVRHRVPSHFKRSPKQLPLFDRPYVCPSETTWGRIDRFLLNLLVVRFLIYNLFRRTLLLPCSGKWYLSTKPHDTVHQKKKVLVQTSVNTHKSMKYGALVYNFNILGKIYNTAFKMYLDDDFFFLCLPLIFTVWRFHFICFLKTNSDIEVRYMQPSAISAPCNFSSALCWHIVNRVMFSTLQSYPFWHIWIIDVQSVQILTNCSHCTRVFVRDFQMLHLGFSLSYFLIKLSFFFYDNEMQLWKNVSSPCDIAVHVLTRTALFWGSHFVDY
jgi:hypothetical protein